MLTVGGILYDETDKEAIKSMALDNLEFIRDDDKYFEIIVPHLTYREIQALDKFLPEFHSNPKIKEEAFNTLKDVVSTSAIEKYAKIYRYFPIYKEIGV
jgi:hypothetical protein